MRWYDAPSWFSGRSRRPGWTKVIKNRILPADLVKFYPVGEIIDPRQIIAELRTAGERMEIQAGVMKEWAERFHAFAAALSDYEQRKSK